MRNHMQKKIPFTKIHLARIDPNYHVQPIEPMICLGKLTINQIRSKVIRRYDHVTIVDTELFYQTYIMRVEEFINYGKIKEEEKNYG